MLVGTYNPSLVLVSLGVAVLASYTALGMANRVRGQRLPAARYWLSGGAFAMGIGIWAMHFVGMLAFSLPIDMGYDIPLTLLSLAIAIGCSAFALWTVCRDELPQRRLAVGALLMGAGIAAMHYVGMAAMRMQPGIVYHRGWFALSILIAVAASGALWITYRLRHDGPRMASRGRWRRWRWGWPSSACTTPACRPRAFRTTASAWPPMAACRLAGWPSPSPP